MSAHEVLEAVRSGQGVAPEQVWQGLGLSWWADELVAKAPAERHRSHRKELFALF
jgi:hypothetical protein